MSDVGFSVRLCMNLLALTFVSTSHSRCHASSFTALFLDS